MSALRSEPIPKADMSATPPQSVVTKSRLAEYRATTAAKSAPGNAGLPRATLADDFKFDAATLKAANSGRGRMTNETSGAGSDKPAWEQPDMAGKISPDAGSSRSMNAFKVSMGLDDSPAEQPIYTANATRSVDVDASIEQESSVLSFMNNNGDTRDKTEMDTPKAEADEPAMPSPHMAGNISFDINPDRVKSWKAERVSRAPGMEQQAQALAGRLDPQTGEMPSPAAMKAQQPQQYSRSAMSI